MGTDDFHIGILANWFIALDNSRTLRTRSFRNPEIALLIAFTFFAAWAHSMQQAGAVSSRLSELRPRPRSHLLKRGSSCSGGRTFKRSSRFLSRSVPQKLCSARESEPSSVGSLG